MKENILNIKLISTILVVTISGCGGTQQTLNSVSTYKKSTVKSIPVVKQENIKFNTCIKECEKYPKSVSLFKDGFYYPIKYNPIYDNDKENVLIISASQRNENSTPLIGIFFKQVKWVNKVYFLDRGVGDYLLKSLTEVKKDWSKIPINAEKKYKPYYNSSRGFIMPVLYNKNGIKTVQLSVIGEHSVHKIHMNLDEIKLNKIIDTLQDLHNQLKGKYRTCVYECYDKYNDGTKLTEDEKWNKEVDRLRKSSTL